MSPVALVSAPGRRLAKMVRLEASPKTPPWKPMSAAWGVAETSVAAGSVPTADATAAATAGSVVVAAGVAAAEGVAAAGSVGVALGVDEPELPLELLAEFPPDLGGIGPRAEDRSMLNRVKTPRARLSISTLSRLSCVCRRVTSMEK